MGSRAWAKLTFNTDPLLILAPLICPSQSHRTCHLPAGSNSGMQYFSFEESFTCICTFVNQMSHVPMIDVSYVKTAA